ncbi:MAG: NADH-quinone oxidoreductase subunit D [Myxococcales bacterium]|nr:NADH-quinone oxidoreductase subunit D [Myxococcales bacterium]
MELEIQNRGKEGGALETSHLTLNMGPHHPSTHGVLRFILETDGEMVLACKPDIGFLHRSIEKIAEKMPYHQFMPYTDRVDYVAAMNANHAYALAVERLAEIEVPRKGQYVRMIAAEFCRIASHLIAVGTMGMDIGAATPFTYALREREWINDLMESLCGARLTFNFIRIGGVPRDLPPGFEERARKFLDYFDGRLEEYNRLLTGNKIFRERTIGVGTITREDALGYGLVGPNLRGSGVDYDVRRDDPYDAYGELKFRVPVADPAAGPSGDCYARYWTRIQEIAESTKILRQLLDGLPEGPCLAKLPRKLKPRAGSMYTRSESARGEMGVFIVSDGTDVPWRVKFRTGSFAAMSLMEKIMPGWFVADVVAIIASFDVVAPETDR